ncbi:PEP/pyruvate-binding domain-containing protein [Fodinicola acaciae]|uniref:PEP/pyruvate-binding domain-containing protein n=1 Tax=Fodinicola acaciae TaxID=2681555 RepID=UPI0013D0816D|nr:PEP/pyruvate-binding domain-containing protein [Fodinicola acaciae]
MTQVDAKLTLSLSEIDRDMLAEVGGKAANLGVLTSAGFPVPEGFCVTTEAYARVAPDLDFDAPDLATKARAALLDAEVPPDLADAIRRAYAEIGGPVAVRSSATAEDLPDASFAGQQDTYLHIIGGDAVIDAVRRCWASLWTDRAVAYRQSNDVDHRSVKLAVVVQKMVEATTAGVLLTANPVTGRRHEALIDASPGLGEAVVSGAVNPDHFAVYEGEITERRLGDKRTVVRPLPGGGTETVELPENSAVACVTDDQIHELAAIGDRVERIYQAPQDIEWAYDQGGKLWLTQSRPITTLFPVPTPEPAELRAYVSANVAQGMFRPFTPMGLAVFRLIGSEMAGIIGRRVADPRQGPAPLATAAGRIFIDMTAGLRSRVGRELLPRIFEVMEARSAAIVRGLFDDPHFSVVHRSRWPLVKAVGPALLKFHAPRQVLQALVRPAETRKRVAGLRKRLSDGVPPATDAAGHLRAAEWLLTHRAAHVIPQVAPPLMTGLAAYVVAGKLMPQAAPQLREAVLRAMPHNVTTEMDLRLWRMSRDIKADPTAAAEMRETSAAELAKRYHAGTLAATTQRELAEFLDNYGDRSVAEIDIGMPRWSDDPTHILGVLANYLRMDEDRQAPDAQFARAAREAEEAVRTLTATAPWGRRHLVGFLLRRSRELIGLRESPKFTIISAFGIVRRHLTEVGRALVDGGLLADASDVFFLDFGEIELVIGGDDLRGLVAERRETYDREVRRRHVPRVLMSDGTMPEPASGDLPPGALGGTPASSGTVTGVARVIQEPTGAHLEPGEILVAPSTDPGWTPLFLTAGGLVMEMGGANSHGAMVAREYGIPAVVGVPDATHRIKTGDTITVDGGAGVVSVRAE